MFDCVGTIAELIRMRSILDARMNQSLPIMMCAIISAQFDGFHPEALSLSPHTHSIFGSNKLRVHEIRPDDACTRAYV